MLTSCRYRRDRWPSHGPRRSLILLVIVMAGGCGVSDYEQRMDRDRKRWQQFDEANKLLAGPLDLPTQKVWEINSETKKKEAIDKPAFPEEMFLRPPKGVSASVKETDGVFHSGRAALFCYAGDEGMNLLLAMCKDEQLQDEKKKFDERQLRAFFQAEVSAALGRYAQKVRRRGVPFPKEWKLTEVSLPPFWIRQGKQPDVAFQQLTVDDAPERRYLLCFHRAADLQVAIIFDMAHKTALSAAGKQAVEYSLKSFGLGADVARNRLAYDQWKRSQ